jgi:spore coat protein JB
MTEQEKAMLRVQQNDFALTEVNLFLDTHPQCAEALSYYQRVRNQAALCRAEYEEKYGPITIFGVEDDNYWDWVKTPWPWEKDA